MSRQRFCLTLFLILAVGWGLVMSQPATAATDVGVVNTGALNLRSGPGVGYPPISIVYEGYSVTLIGRNASGTWLNVRTASGVAGWLSSAYVSVTTSTSALPVINVATLENTAVIGNTQRANIRAGDSIDYAVVGTAGLDERVVLLGRNINSSWAKVRVIRTGLEGWLNGDYLNPSGIGYLPLAAVPVLTNANSAAAATAAQATGSTALVTAGSLNVRRGDDSSYDRIATVAGNTAVTILGRNADSSWAYIRLASGQEGWVNANYLRYDPGVWTLPVRTTATVGQASPTSLLATQALPANNGTPVTLTGSAGAVTTYVTTALNVRSGPGTNYTTVGLVFGGERLAVIARSADSAWLKVQTPAGTGWLYAPLTVPSGNTASLPVATQ